MTSLELLQEIDAWLSFNNHPSKEQINELRNDIKKHISEQLNISVMQQSEQLVCPNCKLPFTKEELQIKEHCFNCGMITTELTIEFQKEILEKMFGFTLVDESDGGEPHYVVYDEDGNEFYGSNENCKYDLSTFGGIIRYAEDRGYKMGYLSCQMDMRKVLGIS